jgi:murein DD-endopeptidase MepM/ murein hydrolase activator NlpD
LVRKQNPESGTISSKIKGLVRRRPAILGALLCTLLILGGFAFGAWRASKPRLAQLPPPAPVKQIPEVSAPAPDAPTAINVTVGKNDTLDSIFRRASLSLSDLAAIRALPGARAGMDQLKVGDLIRLTHRNGDVQSLSRKVSETETMNVERGANGFVANITENPLDVRVRTATATIDSSLFQAAESAKMSDPIALKLAAVFAWDIDFVLDIRQGDQFTVEYQQVYQDGKYLRDGEVLAAEFVNNGHTYRTVRYVGESGHPGYYTPDGRPMRKAFLRAPVDFTRVSSAFNPHRLHPILNTIRGHMGTDYAAPIGTPVHVAGDGRVSFVGIKGGYGNCIMVSHGGSVATLYGHLSRFARVTRVGARVDQGEVIGFVGMTGLATGPHLHYEYLVNGVHKNPQTVQLPGAEPLRAQALAEFHERTAGLLVTLVNGTPGAPPGLVAGGGPPGASAAPVAAAEPAAIPLELPRAKNAAVR